MMDFPPGLFLVPGFQESEHTYVEVTIYQHGDDPVVLAGEPFVGFTLNGQKPSDKAPSITAVQTQKQLGSASGNFQISVKPSQEAVSLFDKLVDDDWVDITFYKNDKGYHVMRGMLDEIRRGRGVSGSGATTEAFTLTGRDFGKVWEQTPVWFSPFANDFVTQAYSTQIFDGVPEMYGSPGIAPLVFLRDFMEKITSVGGVNWAPPLGIPGMLTSTFIGNIAFNEKPPLVGSSGYFQNIPMRNQYNPNGMNPNGMLWDLAYEYSDAMFTELYTDVLPGGNPFSERLFLGDPVANWETQMTVVLRDKPFPFLPTSVPPGFVSTWNLLPTHYLSRQEIVDDNTGRSGFERYNAFFVAPRLFQETMGSHALYVIAPLLDEESIRRHGLRRMDIQSNVVPDPNNPAPWGGNDASALSQYQRQLLRDWYCMNPYLLSGTFGLGHGRPDIKIGSKLTVPGTVLGPTEIEGDETYYVESVGHSWQAKRGTRSNIGVTRGWIGSDAEYMAMLATVASKFKVPALTVASPV